MTSGVLVVVACGVAAFFWAGAKGYLTVPLANWVSTQIGRSISVDGGVRVEFGRVTRVTASGLRLANVSWGSRPDMLRARRLIVDLDTRSLFRNTVVIRQLTVEGLDLQLERNEAGGNNWTFKFKPHKPSTDLPVLVEAAVLPGAKVRFAGPRLQRALELVLATVEEHSRADGMLDLVVRGAAGDTPLELQLSVGPLKNLIDARGFGGQASGRLGDITLGITARVDSWKAPVDTETALSLHAPDADYLASRLGLRSFGGGPVALEIKIVPAAAGAGVQGDVSGQIGEFAVSAHGSLSKAGSSPNFALQAKVAGPDFSRIGTVTGVSGLPPGPFDLRLDVARTGDLTRLQRMDLDLVDGRLSASGTLGPAGKWREGELQFTAVTPDIAKIERRLGLKPVLSGRFEASGSLQHAKGAERALQLNATTTVGQFVIKGTLGDSPKLYGTRLAVSASGGNFARLGRVLKLPAPQTGSYKAVGELVWQRGGIVLRGTRLTVADEKLTVDGSLGKPVFGPGTDLQVEAGGNNADRLGRQFGIKGLPASAYRIAGRVQRQSGRTVLTGVNANVSGAALQLSGTLGDLADRSATDLAFVVSGPDLADFRGLVADAAWPHGKFRASGQLAAADAMFNLRNVQASLGDAQGTLSADLALPLTTATMQFDVEATVPDLARLLPGNKVAAIVGKNLRVVAAGSRLKDHWSTTHLRLENGSDLFDAQGELDLAPTPGAKDVLLEIRLASLQKVGLPGGHLWPDQPAALHTRYSGTGAEVSLRDLTGRVGTSDFAGSVAAHSLRGQPDVDIRLSFGKLDLDPYLERRSPPPAPAAKKTVGPDDRLVIPAEDLSLPKLNRFTGKLDLKAQDLRFLRQDFKDLNIRATLRDGHLQVNPLAMAGEHARADMRIDVRARDRGVAAQLSGTARNLRLSPLLTSVGGANASVYSAQIDLKGSGASLREFAATLNGQIRLSGTGGRVANSGLMAGANDFFKQLLSSVNPVTTRQPTTEVVCVAYLLRAKDGIVDTDPALVMRTAEVDIVSSGRVDLHTERIDFNFKTVARKGLGLGVTQLINPYIKVTGSLGKPGVALDPTGALVNGGAAVATAGLSIVATTVWDRVVHEKNPCAAAVAEADRQARH